MIIRLLLIAAALLAAIWIIQQIKQTPAPKRRSLAWKYGLTVAALAMILLAATGRVHWLGAVIAALLPLVRSLLPMLLRLIPALHHNYRAQQGQQPPPDNQQSTVTTRTLKMTMDHASQTLSGEVISGPFTGATLDQLGLAQLQSLLDYCHSHDHDASKLLITYLKNRFGHQWQQQSANKDSSSMDESEALSILGLKPGASREEIITAHRKLMQKFHPDRGGNDYLAARINQAKDLLFKNLG